MQNSNYWNFCSIRSNDIDYCLQEADKAKVVEVNLGCRDRDAAHRYRLFVTTFLGFGANEAIARYHRHTILSQLKPNDKYGTSITLNRILLTSFELQEH